MTPSPLSRLFSIIQAAISTFYTALTRVRDRRRRVRQRLEDIFNRRTFTSVAVVGAMGKLIEVSAVPFLDPSSAVSLGRVFAWSCVFAVSVVVSVYWERLARAAEKAADAAEEAAEGAAEQDSDS